MARLIRMVTRVALSLTTLAVLGINTTAAHAQGTGSVDVHQTADYTAAAHTPGAGKLGSGPRPDIPPAYCLGATQSAKVTGTNTWSQYGNVTNNCGTPTYNGFIELTANLTCGGSPSTTSDTIILNDPWPNGVTYGYNKGGQAECEECQNGQPVAFPPIQATLEMLAAGDDGPPDYQELDGVPNNQDIPITLSNSPNYAFPCP